MKIILIPLIAKHINPELLSFISSFIVKALCSWKDTALLIGLALYHWAIWLACNCATYLRWLSTSILFTIKCIHTSKKKVPTCMRGKKCQIWSLHGVRIRLLCGDIINTDLRGIFSSHLHFDTPFSSTDYKLSTFLTPFHENGADWTVAKWWILRGDNLRVILPCMPQLNTPR